MTRNTAQRRYERAILLLSIAYAGVLVPDVYLFKHHLLAGPLAYAAAVLPGLAIVGMFAVIGRYLVEERDEYLQMLMVRQSLVASAFALTLATIWGFLESFDLVAHVESYYVAVLWFGGLGVGSCVNLILGRRGAA